APTQEPAHRTNGDPRGITRRQNGGSHRPPPPRGHLPGPFHSPRSRRGRRLRPLPELRVHPHPPVLLDRPAPQLPPAPAPPPPPPPRPAPRRRAAAPPPPPPPPRPPPPDPPSVPLTQAPPRLPPQPQPARLPDHPADVLVARLADPLPPLRPPALVRRGRQPR